jgi:hypothetical protein
MFITTKQGSKNVSLTKNKTKTNKQKPITSIYRNPILLRGGALLTDICFFLLTFGSTPSWFIEILFPGGVAVHFSLIQLYASSCKFFYFIFSSRVIFTYSILFIFCTPQILGVQGYFLLHYFDNFLYSTNPRGVWIAPLPPPPI